MRLLVLVIPHLHAKTVKFLLACLHTLFKSLVCRNIIVSPLQRIRQTLQTGNMFLVVMGVLLITPIAKILH